ncbi:MAG: 3-isopropylmalate dehydratase large subunit [Conexivisphaerales archaeon]
MSQLGKTIAEKIFSRASGRDLRAGDYAWIAPDLMYLHDALGPLTLSSFRKIGLTKIGYKGRKVFVMDHIFPPKDIDSANNILELKNFAKENGIEVFEGDGIEHTLLIQEGIIRPGMFVVGGDSHTVTAGAVGAMGVGLGSTDLAAIMALGVNWFMTPESIRIELIGEMRRYVTGKDIILSIIKQIGVDGANYMSMEFGGESLKLLGIDERLAIANMTVEAGAKCGIIEPDDIITSYYKKIGLLPDSTVTADYDAKYSRKIELHMESLLPQVAAPFSPGDVHDVSQVEGVKIDQAYIGNCANGTLTDLKQAAEILRGRTVHEGVKLIVVPATRRIYLEALQLGIIQDLIKAGAVISPSTCGACGGLHLGVLGKGEVAIANTNRNFRGRMGHPDSKVYLANSFLVAAAAVEGRIVNPEVVF